MIFQCLMMIKLKADPHHNTHFWSGYESSLTSVRMISLSPVSFLPPPLLSCFAKLSFPFCPFCTLSVPSAELRGWPEPGKCLMHANLKHSLCSFTFTSPINLSPSLSLFFMTHMSLFLGLGGFKMNFLLHLHTFLELCWHQWNECEHPVRLVVYIVWREMWV